MNNGSLKALTHFFFGIYFICTGEDGVYSRVNEQGDIILTNVDGSEPKVFLPGANITNVSTCPGARKH